MGNLRSVNLLLGTMLARDLKFLAENGYVLQKVVPVDMFLRTMHVETVVLMSCIKDCCN